MENETKTKLCKHCQSEIPKKAKVCPYCRKKQGGKLKWIVIAVLVFFLVPMIFCGDDKNKKQSNHNEKQNVSTVHNSYEKLDVTKEINYVEYIDIIGEYSCDNAGDLMRVLILKNNSEDTLEISVNATAMDSSGKVLGATDSIGYAFGANEELFLVSYFSDVDINEAVEFDYKINASEDDYYESMLQYLDFEESIVDNKVVIKCTNNYTEPLIDVEANAIFFKDGKEIDTFFCDFVDNDYELKAGDTHTGEITCYEGSFDEVKLYYGGRIEK